MSFCDLHFPTKSELQQMKQVEGTIEDRQACHFGRGEGRVKGGDRRQIQLVSTQKLKKHPQRFLNGRLSKGFYHCSIWVPQLAWYQKDHFIQFISKLPNLKLVTLAPTLTPFMALQEFLYHPVKLCKILLGECSIMSYITWWNVFIRAEGKVSFFFNEGSLLCSSRPRWDLIFFHDIDIFHF